MNITELNKFTVGDAVNFHNDLNPQLYHNGNMRDNIRNHLLGIANDFIEFMGVEDIALVDITLSGSNAAFTYTPHSDIDLHVLVDFDKLQADDIYKELFDAKKYQYNEQHNIKVKGYEVELYVQDSKQTHTSLGEYSIYRNEWNRIPTINNANVDDDATVLKYKKLRQVSLMALASDDETFLTSVLDTIKRYRQAGLDEGGEFSSENLAFKMLRAHGITQRLWDKRHDYKSKELSLEDNGNIVNEITEEFNNFNLNEQGRIVKNVNTMQDVGLDEITIQAKKMGFEVTRDGIPAYLATNGKHPEPITESIGLDILAGFIPQKVRDWLRHKLHKKNYDVAIKVFKDIMHDESRNIKPEMALIKAAGVAGIDDPVEHRELLALLQSHKITEDQLNELHMGPTRLEKEVQRLMKVVTPIIGVELEVCLPAGQDVKDMEFTPRTTMSDFRIFFRDNHHDELSTFEKGHIAWLFKHDAIDTSDEEKYSFGSYLIANDYRWASDIYNDNQDTLEWPGDSGRDGNYNILKAKKIADTLTDDIGIPTDAVATYHSGHRPEDKWVIEPDQSIQPEEGDIGFEVISYPMEYSEGIGEITDVIELLKQENCYTNGSTGLHVNVSIDGMGQSGLDYVKLVLLSGDAHILKHFGRTMNNFASDTYKQLVRFLNPNVNSLSKSDFGPEKNAERLTKALITMKTKLNDAVENELPQIDFGKYSSIGIKPGYIEFRAAGNNYLDDVGTIVNTINRFIVSYAVAANPDEGRKEYAKKLYKLLTTHAPDNANKNTNEIMKLFALFSAGKINELTLKDQIGELQNTRATTQNKTMISPVIAELQKKYNWYRDWELQDKVNKGIEIERNILKNPKEALKYVLDVMLHKQVNFYDMSPGDARQYIELRKNQSNESINEEELTEVDMSPSGLQGAVDNILQKYTPMIGIEAECIIGGNGQSGQPAEYPEVNQHTSMDDILEYFEDNSAEDLEDLRNEYDNWTYEKESEYSENQVQMAMNTPWEEDHLKVEVLEGITLYDDDAEKSARLLTGIDDEEDFPDIDADMAQNIVNEAHKYYKLHGDAKMWYSEENEHGPTPEEDPAAVIYYAVFIEDEDNREPFRDFYSSDFWESQFPNEYEYTIGSYLKDARGITTFEHLAQHHLGRMLNDYNAYNGEGGFDYDTASDIGSQMEHEMGLEVIVSTDYHTTDRDETHWIIEEDPSIGEQVPVPDGASAMEIISPPIEYERAVTEVEEVFNLIKENDGYTTADTGLHINVSINGINHSDVDYIKLVLLLGDKHIADSFERYGNKYAESSIEHIESMLQPNSFERNRTNLPQLMDNMKSKLNKSLQNTFKNTDVDFGKYVTAGIKDNRIEFRAAGNANYLDNWPKILNTINRFVAVYAIAADPTAYTKEYAKKLYLIAMKGHKRWDNMVSKNAVTLFVAYSSGKIDSSDLKAYLKRRQSDREDKKQAEKEGEWKTPKELQNNYTEILADTHNVEYGVADVAFQYAMEKTLKLTGKVRLTRETVKEIFTKMKANGLKWDNESPV